MYGAFVGALLALIVVLGVAVVFLVLSNTKAQDAIGIEPRPGVVGLCDPSRHGECKFGEPGRQALPGAAHFAVDLLRNHAGAYVCKSRCWFASAPAVTTGPVTSAAIPLDQLAALVANSSIVIQSFPNNNQTALEFAIFTIGQLTAAVSGNVVLVDGGVRVKAGLERLGAGCALEAFLQDNFLAVVGTIVCGIVLVNIVLNKSRREYEEKMIALMITIVFQYLIKEVGKPEDKRLEWTEGKLKHHLVDQTNSSADKKKALALWPKVVAAIRKDERIRRLEKNIKGKQESVWTWELAGDEVPHVAGFDPGFLSPFKIKKQE